MIIHSAMDYRVTVEAGVTLNDVETREKAVNIAISSVGNMLNNNEMSYVEITAPEDEQNCFIVANKALVRLELEYDVFDVDEEEHAVRISKKELGQNLDNIPLEVVSVEEVETQEDDE